MRLVRLVLLRLGFRALRVLVVRLRVGPRLRLLPRLLGAHCGLPLPLVGVRAALRILSVLRSAIRRSALLLMLPVLRWALTACFARRLQFFLSLLRCCERRFTKGIILFLALFIDAAKRRMLALTAQLFLQLWSRWVPKMRQKQLLRLRRCGRKARILQCGQCGIFRVRARFLCQRVRLAVRQLILRRARMLTSWRMFLLGACGYVVVMMRRLTLTTCLGLVMSRRAKTGKTLFRTELLLPAVFLLLS